MITACKSISLLPLGEEMGVRTPSPRMGSLLLAALCRGAPAAASGGAAMPSPGCGRAPPVDPAAGDGQYPAGPLYTPAASHAPLLAPPCLSYALQLAPLLPRCLPDASLPPPRSLPDAS